MNIALIVHDLHEHGGHSLYTKILADGLSRNHGVTVFANSCAPSNGHAWKFRPVSALRVNALSSVQTFPLGLRMHRAELAKFDVAHAQGYCGGHPNVVTAHICVASYLESLRSISLRNRVSIKLMARAESRFYRGYNGQVIAISDRIARDLQHYYQISGPIRVIPHGVDSARFTSTNRMRFRSVVRSELGIDDDRTVALYVGDLTKAHTHLKSLAAAAPEIQLVVVTPSQGYRWSGKNVYFLSPTTQIERYYAAADAFVFPTTYDAFGLVVLEAMASGLPVFVSDRAGASELINSAKDGFVLSLEEWTESTLQKLRDRELLNAVGREAETKARLHDWGKVTSEVEKLYAQVVGR